MARRADMPRRTMENYFKGHKPSYDALITMADAFGVPTDFLCGLKDLEGSQSEDIIERAAKKELSSFLRFLVHQVGMGRAAIKGGRVFGSTPDEKAAEIARAITWRASSVLTEYPEKADSDVPDQE